MSDPATIALNMIVRNEADILERCLASLAPHIDYWVILDTGSQDATPTLIEAFFHAAGIPGQLHHGEFTDFGATRNAALELCRVSPGGFNYILLIDADMELVVEDAGWRERLDAACYSIRQRNALAYDNVRLLRRDLEAHYVGVTHEYLATGSDPVRLSGVHMLDHACGANRENKSERDVTLLRQDLDREPDNTRNLFYLAQSLYDAGQHLEALECYRKRSGAGGWEEEAWYSQYRAALCLRELGDTDGFMAAALASWDTRPWRAEPLAALARHYRESGRWQLACEFAALGLRIPFPEADRLFIETDVYPWRFVEELSIAGYYAKDAGHRELGRSCCNRLATQAGVPEHMRHLARSNIAFYAQDAAGWLGLEILPALDVTDEPGWACLNPSVCRSDDRQAVIVRQCNYRIENGRYVIDDPNGVIRTRNHLAPLNAALETPGWFPVVAEEADMQQPLAPRFPFPVRGYEDCRLLRWRGHWWATATVRDTTPEGLCEMALLRLDDNGKIREEVLLRGDWSSRHQKNWMPLVDGDDLLFVYSLDPTVILKYDPERRVAAPYRESEPAGACEHLRGGSQLLRTPAGWLGVCHEAAIPAGGPRTYLHRFFLLDSDLRLAGLSEPFRFTAEPIEFCAGLALDQNGQRLLLSFGVNDAQAFIGTVDLGRVLEILNRGAGAA
jgi:tetratricopeptide (TPR) repeat protein